MAIGAMIGLTLVLLFFISADPPDPAWGTYWRVRPLIVVPLATGFGGIIFYLLSKLNYKNRLMKILVFIFRILIFTVSLWLGFVAGFNGTYWN